MTQESFADKPLRKPALWLALAIVVAWVLCGGVNLLGGSTRHHVGYVLTGAGFAVGVYALLFNPGTSRVIVQLCAALSGIFGFVLFSTSVTGSVSHRLHVIVPVMVVLTVLALPCILGLMVLARKVNARAGQSDEP